MGHCRRWGKQLWRECWRLWCWWWCCAGSSRAGCSGNSFVEALNSDQVFSENLCSREPELSKTIFVVCGMPVFQIIRRLRIIFIMILKKNLLQNTKIKFCSGTFSLSLFLHFILFNPVIFRFQYLYSLKSWTTPFMTSNSGIRIKIPYNANSTDTGTVTLMNRIKQGWSPGWSRWLRVSSSPPPVCYSYHCQYTNLRTTQVSFQNFCRPA